MLSLFLECALRSALIAAGTGGVLAILRVKSARARHLAWASVVVVMLVLPLWTAWGPKAPLRVLPAGPAPVVNRAIPAASASARQALAAEFHLENPLPAGSLASYGWTSLAVLYLLGVAALLVRLSMGTIRAQGLIRTATHREGMLTSASCSAPVTVGWLHPTVILPECWREWPRNQLDAVLAHEREHARRRDPLVQWLALLNRVIFWFHPLAWYLEQRLSGLAEEACDAAVLAQGHDPYEYSNCLIEIAQSVVRSGTRVHVLGMAMPGSFLADRIRQILEGRPAPRLTRARMACAAVGCAVLSSVFAAGAVDRRTPEPALGKVEAPAIEAFARAAAPVPLPVDTPKRPVPRPPVLVAQAQTTPAPQARADSQEALYKDRRMLAMYFDLTGMTEADLSRAIGAAQKFVRVQMLPRDVVAVMTYGRGGVFKVLQDFTDDRDRLAETLQQLGAGQSASSSGVSSADLRLTSIRTAVQMLGRVDGKKLLLFFAAGTSSGSDTQEERQAVIDSAIRANVAIYPIDVRAW